MQYIYISIGELFSLHRTSFLTVIPLDPVPFPIADPNWSFREHISHALPTERIFHLLRLISSKYLMRDYDGKLIPDILEIIIKWLQVSVS